MSLFASMTDWIWPRLKGKAEASPDDRCYFDSSHAELVPAIESNIRTLAEQAEERFRTVERKLIALLTLTTVLGAAVTASLLGVAVLDQVRDSWYTRGGTAVAIIMVSYILAQILCSLMATLRGLTRRGYRQLAPNIIIPLSGETGDAYRIRLLNSWARAIAYNEWVVGGKVSEMAVAHVALRNALWGIVPLLCVAAVLAVLQVLCG